MEPNTSQPNQGSLDPSVVALTKALGSAESGGDYTAGDHTGDMANSQGAYQMTPGFLKKWAPSSGVQYQEGTALTPAQQDQIAYNAVQTMGTTGDPSHPSLGKLSPSQIASAWNTGDPNAYANDPLGYENNTYGNLEKYVNKVKDYYTQQTQSQNPSSSFAPTANAASSPVAGGNSNSSQPQWLPALEAAGLGGLGWLASKAQKPLQDAATDAATDAIVGTILEPGAGTLAGAAGGAIEGTIRGIVQDFTDSGNPTQSGQSTGGTETQSSGQTQQPIQLSGDAPTGESTEAAQLVNNAIHSTLQGTQSGRVYASDPNQHASIAAASGFGLVHPNEDGTLQFDEEKRKALLSEIANLDDKTIASDGGSGSPLSVSNYAGSYIGNSKLQTKEDREKAGSRVGEILKGEAPNGISGQMPLSDMRERQKEHYAKASKGYREGATTSELLAHKAIGHAYGRAIDESLKDPVAKDLHQRAKKVEQSLIRAKDLKKHIQGKKAPQQNGAWEKFLRQGARAAEIYIGEKLGGPIGAIIGGFAGEHFNNHLNKKFGRNIFETKPMRAALDTLRDTKPKEYQNLIKAFKERGVDVPKDQNNKPNSESGLVKQVEKDEKKFKGLVSLKKPYKG